MPSLPRLFFRPASALSSVLGLIGSSTVTNNGTATSSLRGGRRLPSSNNPSISSSPPSSRSRLDLPFGLTRIQLLQRLPFIIHLACLFLVIYGERHPITRVMYIAFVWGVHLALINTNIRSAYAVWRAGTAVIETANTDWRAKYELEKRTRQQRRQSAADRRTLDENQVGLLEDDDDDEEVIEFEDVLHVIIIPNYMEDIQTLRDTLLVLASHPAASRTYHPLLGFEAREATSAIVKAETLLAEFSDAFRGISYTIHPEGLENEVAGKSSNVAWAARSWWMSRRQQHSDGRSSGQRSLSWQADRTVLTTIDSDTAFAADYFAAATYKFASRNRSERARMMMMPTICFDRNAHEVPVTVRVTDIAWSLVGMSTLHESSVAKVPTSAYSVSLRLAERVDGWDTDAIAIGEDMHMLLKCQLSTGGNVVAETIFSPASQLNIVGKVRGGIAGWVSDYQARYKQALRHLWGSLDVAYVLNRLMGGDVNGLRHNTRNKTTSSPPRDSYFVGPRHGPVFSLAKVDRRTDADDLLLAPPTRSTSPDLSSAAGDETILSTSVTSIDSEDDVVAGEHYPPSSKGSSSMPECPPTDWYVIAMVCTRVWEACLMMGSIAIVVAVGVIRQLYARVFLPDGALESGAGEYGTDKLRHLSLALWVVTSVFYDRYHRATASVRWEQDARGKLGSRPVERSDRPVWTALVDYAALPLSIAFGPIAMFHAQFMHLFTNKLTYSVSLKRQSTPTAKAAVAVSGDDATAITTVEV